MMTRKTKIDEDLRAEIRAIVREEIQQAMGQGATITELEIPPTFKEKVEGKKGKKVSPGTRVKIGYTVDSGIMAAFQAERKRLRLTPSELIDRLLWNALGKPKLSFEEDE